MILADQFFLIVAATVLITRVFLFLYPMPTPKIGSFRPHHWMTGLALIPIGLLLHSIWIYAIGVGLFIDELTFVLMRGQSHEDNYSRISLAGVATLLIIVFIARHHLTAIF